MSDATKVLPEITVPPCRSAGWYIQDLLTQLIASSPDSYEGVSWRWVQGAVEVEMTLETAECYRALAMSILKDGLPA